MIESLFQSCFELIGGQALIASSGLVTTAMPSFATWISVYLIPSFLQACDLLGLDRPRGVGDVGLAGAELLEAAAGTGPPTVILTSGFSPLKSSAAASANGKTVLEPSMLDGSREVAAAVAAVAAAAGGGTRDR